MASKKRNVVPDIEEFFANRKRNKRLCSILKECCETLRSLTQDEVIGKEEDIATWLVSKYGFNSVSKAVEYYGRIPVILSGAERNKLFREEGSIICELIQLIEELCPSLLHQQPQASAFSAEENFFTIAPPVHECIECGNVLSVNHTCSVKVYSLEKASKAQKITLRCKKCSLQYNFDKYGTKSGDGFHFYKGMRELVEVSDTVYFKRDLVELQCSLANHAWTSFQGFSQAYNDALDLPKEMEMSPETCANAFYNGELEIELRRIGKDDYCFKYDHDREKCMQMIERYRRENVYPHREDNCSTDCKARGCGKLWVTDGVWKLSFPHCMYKVEVLVEGIPTLHLPDICTDTPRHGKAFCYEHCKLLEESAPNVPTGLRDFLKYSGAFKDNSDVISDEVCILVEEAVSKLPTNTVVDKSAADAQGISSFVSNYPSIVHDAIVESGENLCRKDTGLKSRLRKWSRGHQFIVRGGGHIDAWQPLYRSESPSQVFLILVNWLVSLSKVGNISTPPPILAYDNMCNLERIKASRKPLPLPPPNDQIWANVTKIIDVFHFKNHVSPDCREKFSPEAIKKDNPFYNTQAGEQTFTWLARFKHNVCSMNKDHHLFYLHRMVVRRNSYTEKCYKYGRKPLLPKGKN